MECINCHKNDWENVDQFRIKPKGMSICKNCGMVSYPNLWKSKDDILKHYKKDYRKAPTSNNIFTGQKKLFYHEHFLRDWIDIQNKENKKPKILEVGAAFGMVLNFFQKAVKDCEIYGTELTETFKRVAHHEYNIRLDDDFDETKKYDLIMSYKVAEHQLDFDKELLRYRNCLAENGLLYISVPTWFDSMTNFGMAGFDLEYYYDTNHINVWTRKIFEGMLANAGFKIQKQDHFIYDSTYLCSVSEKTSEIVLEDIDQIKGALYLIKKASDYMLENDFNNAIKTYPDFPLAHITRFEYERKQAFNNGWDFIKKEYLDFAIKCCPNSSEVMTFAIDICMRASQFELALKLCEENLKLKPQNLQTYMQLINIYRELAINNSDEVEKEKYFTEALKITQQLKRISLQHLSYAIDMSFLMMSHIPIK